MSNTKIGITGATGLVGSHLTEYLAKHNYNVKALVRSYTNTSLFSKTWSDLGVDIQELNILDPDKLEKAMTGIDVIIHTAGIVDPYASAAEIKAVNVGGTKLVLETAIKLGIKQFIFLSSLSVITGNEDKYNAKEDLPLLLCGESYADSKVRAEQVVTDPKYSTKIAITVMRPGFIYGPRERAWLPQLIRAIASGRAILVDGGTKETNVIYVENLNQAVAAAILNDKSYGQVYNLTDGQKITKKELFDAISDVLNLPKIKKNMPSWLIKPIFILISNLVSKMPEEKRRKLSRFSKAAYRLIGVNQGFCVNKAERDLNYINRIPFQIGMANTLLSFKEKIQTQYKADHISASRITPSSPDAVCQKK